MYDVEDRLKTYAAEVKESLKSGRQRRKKMEELTEVAQGAHKTGRYEVSFDKFVYILAIVEANNGEGKGPDEMHAMITSNIASALHFLGEVQLAATYYEKALAEFEEMRVGWITWAMQGQLPQARKAYIQARLAQVAAGERPDPSLYLDGYGKTRQFTQVKLMRFVMCGRPAVARAAHHAHARHVHVPGGAYGGAPPRIPGVRALTLASPIARACASCAQEEMDGTDNSWSIFQPRTWWYGGYKPEGWEPPSRDGGASSTAI